MRVVYGRVLDRNVDDSFRHYNIIVAVWEPRNCTQTLYPNPKPQVYTLDTYENMATMTMTLSSRGPKINTATVDGSARAVVVVYGRIMV